MSLKVHIFQRTGKFITQIGYFGIFGKYIKEKERATTIFYLINSIERKDMKI